MAKTVAKPADKRAAPGPAKPSGKAGGFAVTAAIVVATVMALAALPLTLIVAAGMMPTAAVAMIDRRPRYLSYTVGAMNLAGVFPFLLAVVKANMSIVAAATKLSEPLTWLVMYGAAAAGWLLCGATPMMARACIELQAFQHRRALEALGKAIREEWGPEVGVERDR
jgi:hypothetical protein